jgi:hypothetical protein
MKLTNPFSSKLAIGVTALASAILLMAAKSPPPKFDEIDVGRINIREPDGTLRMVISNRGQFPGSPWKGGEVPRSDRKSFAGMLFVNDEGTENGGLIQKGVIGADGKVSAGLSLTFDRFRQDQAIQLLHAEDGGRASSTLAINDETDGAKFDVMQRAERMKAIEGLDPAARRAAIQEMRDKRQLPNNRVLLGTTGDGAAALSLADAQGRPRMLLLVTAAGQPSVQLLDDTGKPAKIIDLETLSDASLLQRPPEAKLPRASDKNSDKKNGEGK